MNGINTVHVYIRLDQPFGNETDNEWVFVMRSIDAPFDANYRDLFIKPYAIFIRSLIHYLYVCNIFLFVISIEFRIKKKMLENCLEKKLIILLIFIGK